jgi:hypothetical protein
METLMADFKVKTKGYRLWVMPQTREATALVKNYAMKLSPQMALIEGGLFGGWRFIVTGPSSEKIITRWITNAGMEVPAEVVGVGTRNQHTSPPPAWLHDDSLHQTHLGELLGLQP